MIGLSLSIGRPKTQIAQGFVPPDIPSVTQAHVSFDDDVLLIDLDVTQAGEGTVRIDTANPPTSYGDASALTSAGAALFDTFAVAANGDVSGLATATLEAGTTYTWYVGLSNGNGASNVVSGMFTTPIVTTGSPVDPIINAFSFDPGAGGSLPIIDLDVTYTGADTLRAYGATGEDPLTVSQEQLVAQAGGSNVLEYFDFAVTPPFDSDAILGLTGLSNSTNRIVLTVAEENNGGASATSAVTVGGLNFDPPVISTVTIGDIQPSVIAVTFDRPIFGSTSAADWSVPGAVVHSAFIQQPVLSEDVSTVFVVLTQPQDAQSALTLDYAGTGLATQAGVTVAAFTGQAIANTILVYSPDDDPNMVAFGGAFDLAAQNTASDGSGGIPQVGEQVHHFASGSVAFAAPDADNAPFLRQNLNTGHLWWQMPETATSGLLASGVDLSGTLQMSLVASLYSPLDQAEGDDPRASLSVRQQGQDWPTFRLQERNNTSPNRATVHANGNGRSRFTAPADGLPTANQNVTHFASSDLRTSQPRIECYIDGVDYKGPETRSAGNAFPSYGTAEIAIMHNPVHAHTYVGNRGMYAFAVFQAEYNAASGASADAEKTNIETWATSMRPAV